MKMNLMLISSASVNVALCAVCFMKFPPKRPSAEIVGEAVPAVSTMPRVVERSVTNVVTVVEGAEPFDWRRVESDDYKQYVANLRAIGCPEKTLRDIIMADVTDLFRERARNSTNRFEYWKPGLLGNAFDEKRVAQQQARGSLSSMVHFPDRAVLI